MTNAHRRKFLFGAAGLLAALGLERAWSWKHKKSPIMGDIVGAASTMGHRLHGSDFPPPTEISKKKIVIIGGGIAGLSAAWKLHKSGFHDFVLLELEKEVGGNASFGENAVSAYPWGAHYVPLLTEESVTASELFADLNIITGWRNGRPVYNDYYLAADPHDRLFMHGRWQEGIVPQVGIHERDKKQYREFFAEMERCKKLKGRDGRKVFAIPVDKSSRDPRWLALDAISMSTYLRQKGWDAPGLRWYVNYCCRDDYGATMEDVSAWAGIHYFAARTGVAANADAQAVVTWPEGNGWIVKQLKEKLLSYLATQRLVFQVSRQDGGARVRAWHGNSNRSSEIQTQAVIFATPRFISQRLLPSSIDLGAFDYSPWMVANVTLDNLPAGKGVALAWDNVIYNSELLGYVVATHQNLNRVQRQTVLTYYWPITHLAPQQARQQMLARRYEDWRDIILNELLRIHPELKHHVKQLDVWLWGHGMIRPTPGFIWGKARQASVKQTPPFFYGHSDMSGISIFEEANYRGVQAAEAVMTHLRHPHRTSL